MFLAGLAQSPPTHLACLPACLQVYSFLESGSAYHISRKTIPSQHGPLPGVKLELFIFDTFPLAASTALVEVSRPAEFAPVKNAPGVTVVYISDQL